MADGPLITAYVKVNGKTASTQADAKQFLVGFREHFKEAGIGSITEIFNGNVPHKPRGCIAQAWSVAEVLRAYMEDTMRDV